MESTGGIGQKKVNNQSTCLNPGISSPSSPFFPDSWFCEFCESLGEESWFKIFEPLRVCSASLTLDSLNFGLEKPPKFFLVIPLHCAYFFHHGNSSSALETPWSLDLWFSQVISDHCSDLFPHQTLLPSMQLLWGTSGSFMLAMECLNMTTSLWSKLIPLLFAQTFHSSRSASSQPHWDLSHFLVTHPLTSHTDSIHWATNSGTTSFDSPTTDHQSMR